MAWYQCCDSECDFSCISGLRQVDITRGSNVEVCLWMTNHGICKGAVWQLCKKEMELCERTSRSTKDRGTVACWRCVRGDCVREGRHTANSGFLKGIEIPHQVMFDVIYRILHGNASSEIARECELSKNTVSKILGRILTVAEWANGQELLRSAGSFQRGQYDETVVSKRKYNRGHRSRGKQQWMMTEVDVSPSKKTRKVCWLGGLRPHQTPPHIHRFLTVYPP